METGFQTDDVVKIKAASISLGEDTIPVKGERKRISGIPWKYDRRHRIESEFQQL